MQQKLPWAHPFIALSAIRNINKLNHHPYQMRVAQDSHDLEASYLKNLSVFNGLKAIGCFYFILASSFMYTWYAFLADPSQIVEFQ